MTNKDVLNTVTAEMIMERESRMSAEWEVRRLKTEIEKLTKQKGKYRDLYMTQRRAAKRDKQDRALFAKKATDAERKHTIRGFWNKVLFVIKH